MKCNFFIGAAFCNQGIHYTKEFDVFSGTLATPEFIVTAFVNTGTIS